MRRPAVFLVLVIVLISCQSIKAPTPSDTRREESRSLKDPAIAASIMEQFASDLVPRIPQGTKLYLAADQPKVLSDALRETLIKHGFDVTERQAAVQGATGLEIWSTEIDGDLLVRLSTPTLRLSRVYRLRELGDGGIDAMPLVSGVIPVGPLVVETSPHGAAA